MTLCLKFDIDKNLNKLKTLKNFPTKYFNICYIFYAIGITLTFIVLNVFRKPQPALLYLVPCCTLSVLI